MHISLSSSTSFIRQNLMRQFIKKGWTISEINRQSLTMPDEEFLAKKIEGSDAVINLAGAPIQKRWSEKYKEEIYHSRIDTTRKIATSIRNAKKKPGVFISGSAIGIYNQVDTHTDHSSNFADDFISRLCQDWEKEAWNIHDVTRVVIFRTGVVLGSDGGALQTMHTPFKLGLGSVVGTGKQAFS